MLQTHSQQEMKVTIIPINQYNSIEIKQET